MYIYIYIYNRDNNSSSQYSLISTDSKNSCTSSGSLHSDN